MDAMDERTVQWRRDASTSTTVRFLWAFGVGTFLATLAIIVFWRLYDLTGQIGGQSIVVAAFAALAATVLGAAVADRTGRGFPIPLPGDSGPGAERAIDAALAAVAVAATMGVLMGVGRIVSQRELLEVGAGPFTLLVALMIPLALLALLLASFLRSVGTLDREEGVLHLHDPDESVPLEHVEDVSVNPVGDLALVHLEYATPGGQYVPGPRWLALPPAVAGEVRAVVEG